jgi:hypothetical protein
MAGFISPFFLLETSMFYGAVKFFTFVSTAQGDGSSRIKRVTLATVYCDYADAGKKLIEFREENKDNFRDIHARFEYIENLG